jgi:hypothetical protein
MCNAFRDRPEDHVQRPDVDREKTEMKVVESGVARRIALKSAVFLACARTMPPARSAQPRQNYIAARGSHPIRSSSKACHVCQSGARLAHDARGGCRGKGPADRVVQVVRPSGGARSRARYGAGTSVLDWRTSWRAPASRSPSAQAEGPRPSAARCRQHCRSGRCDRLLPVPSL